jgi:phosphoesterase RecJ-like protein
MVIFDQQPESAGQLIEEADTIFALDYNAFHRTDRMEESLTRAKAVKIVIDHHPGPDLEAFDIILSETDISATAELLFQFLTTEYGIDAISKPIAEALYVGILTDTGSFRHSCNRPSTFRTVASLIEKGIDVEYISRQVFDTYSASRLRLLGFSLSHRMLVWDELATVVIYLSKEDLKQFHFHEGDTEGLVNYGLSIKKIQVAVLITERKDTIRLSFRSKSNFDVNQFARQYFNGGGHKKAAGGRSETSMENTIQRLKTGLESCKSQLIAL